MRNQALALLVVQMIAIGFACSYSYAITPHSQAQIQARVLDPQNGINQDIGSLLDEKRPGNVSLTQNLTPKNSVLNAKASTEMVGRLKLQTSISQSTSSDSTPSDGFSAVTNYNVSATAEFRDTIRIFHKKEVPNATVHLVFQLAGGPLSATAPNPGSVSVMNGEVVFNLDEMLWLHETGSTSSSIGKFDGSTQTLDFAIPVGLLSQPKDGYDFLIQIHLFLSGLVSTFYAASNGADYMDVSNGLELVDVYVSDNSTGAHVSGVKIIGDSGYAYLGSSSTLAGSYSGSVKPKNVTFKGKVDSDEKSLNFNLNINGTKYSGVGNVNGIGVVTFGEKNVKTLKLKKKNKNPISLTLKVAQKGENYQITGKITEKEVPGNISFVAKQKD